MRQRPAHAEQNVQPLPRLFQDQGAFLFEPFFFRQECLDRLAKIFHDPQALPCADTAPPRDRAAPVRTSVSIWPCQASTALARSRMICARTCCWGLSRMALVELIEQARQFPGGLIIRLREGRVAGNDKTATGEMSLRDRSIDFLGLGDHFLGMRRPPLGFALIVLQQPHGQAKGQLCQKAVPARESRPCGKWIAAPASPRSGLGEAISIPRGDHKMDKDCS